MSSEVCPFCGKTYKRLKSHLPHCKAASSETPPTKRDVTANRTSSSPLAAALSEPTAKGVKSSKTLSKTDTKKAKKVSPATPLQNAATSSSSQTLSPSGSLPPSTKKKKPKLSEQIKTATMPRISTQSPISNPKKKSLRASIEAAKSKLVYQGSLEGTRSTLEDLPSGLTPFVADPLRSRTAAQTEIKTNLGKMLVKDDAHPVFVPTDTKPKGAVKMKVPKTKKAAKTLSTSKDTSSPVASELNNTSPSLKEDFLMDDHMETVDISLNKSFLTSEGVHQTRITLQDVKATLGRAKTRPSILNQIQTTHDLSSKIRTGSHLGPVSLPTGNQDVDSCLVKTKPLSKQPPSSSSQHTEPGSVKRKSSKSLMPLRHDGSPQPELTSPSDSHHFWPSIVPARVEALRADDGARMENSQLVIMKQNTADDGTKGVLTRRSLGQVRLKELPEWLACKTPTHPRDVVEMVQRGWQWYYKKYIDVKKGGVGGLSMLLAGYCVLGYIWSYPHIKRDRWRKHH
ncbi:ATP synthase subunit f, mitochondrial [Collichthys lucidus]|uniref:ATP synthase subunit f, mitochondrial n=1 Tax=Collichthys lucidus TaxID=240159 RepID=A0A4U5VM72_COLLU|nr:ATP synthase subunit f, mitochondrial [Collichthys lucidus]